MRKAALTLLTMLTLTLMMVLSTGVASAGWGWEDTAFSPAVTKVYKPSKAGAIPHKVKLSSSRPAW